MSRALDWGGLIVLCAAGILSAMIEVLLVPLRAGTIFVPVSVVLAIAGGRLLPQAAGLFVDMTWARVVAFASWLLPVLILTVAARPEGDVLIPAGGGEQWVFYGLLLGGGVTGIVTIVLSAAPRRPVGPSARRPVPVRGAPAKRGVRG